MVDNPVDSGDGHGGVGENFVPFAKWLVGCNDDDSGCYFAPQSRIDATNVLHLILIRVVAQKSIFKDVTDRPSHLSGLCRNLIPHCFQSKRWELHR